jgi:hypothetical protein
MSARTYTGVIKSYNPSTGFVHITDDLLKKAFSVVAKGKDYRPGDKVTFSGSFSRWEPMSENARTWFDIGPATFTTWKHCQVDNFTQKSHEKKTTDLDTYIEARPPTLPSSKRVETHFVGTYWRNRWTKVEVEVTEIVAEKDRFICKVKVHRGGKGSRSKYSMASIIDNFEQIPFPSSN